MIKIFRIGNKFDIKSMSQKVNDMKNLLEKIAIGEIPNESTYTLSDLKKFCKSLIRNQRNELKSIRPGSWCIVPTEIAEEGMPSDARVDFVFFPTYLAISILTRVLLDYPEVPKQIPNYYEVLRKGFIFATYRKLRGHGYNAESEMIEAIKILSLGKVPKYLALNPDFCPEMLQILKDIKKELTEALEKGETKGPWGEDYTEGFKSVVKILEEI